MTLRAPRSTSTRWTEFTFPSPSPSPPPGFCPPRDIGTPAHVSVRDHRLLKQRAVFVMQGVVIAPGEHWPHPELDRRKLVHHSPLHHDDILSAAGRRSPAASGCPVCRMSRFGRKARTSSIAVRMNRVGVEIGRHRHDLAANFSHSSRWFTGAMRSTGARTTSSNAWDRRVLAPAAVPDAKPPRPFVSSHSRPSARPRSWQVSFFTRIVGGLSLFPRISSPVSRRSRDTLHKIIPRFAE